jgi:hypothetical protein
MTWCWIEELCTDIGEARHGLHSVGRRHHVAGVEWSVISTGMVMVMVDFHHLYVTIRATGIMDTAS